MSNMSNTIICVRLGAGRKNVAAGAGKEITCGDIRKIIVLYLCVVSFVTLQTFASAAREVFLFDRRTD